MDDSVATDLIIYQLGSGERRQVIVQPGGVLLWHLKPRAFRSRQPADPISHSPAMSVLATTPLNLLISQGTEPHIFRVNAQLAFAGAGDGTSNCALVSSHLSALTYFNGSPPSS